MIKANSFYKFATYFLSAVLVLIVTQGNYSATAITKKKTLTCVAVTGGGYEGDLATYLNSKVTECVTKLENKGYVVVDIIDLSASADFLVRAEK